MPLEPPSAMESHSPSSFFPHPTSKGAAGVHINVRRGEVKEEKNKRETVFVYISGEALWKIL